MLNTLRELKNNISGLTQEQKEKLGIELMAIGADLYFTTDNDLGHNNHKLKDAINRDTLLGSFADSCGYIHSNMEPMCQYDTQSVINVLRRRHLTKYSQHNSPTDMEAYYKEVWKY